MSDEPARVDDAPDVPSCGQPAWHHDPFYCGRGCPWWTGDDNADEGAP